MGKIRNERNVYLTDRAVVLGTTVRERYKLRVLINHAEAGKAIAFKKGKTPALNQHTS